MRRLSRVAKLQLISSAQLAHRETRTATGDLPNRHRTCRRTQAISCGHRASSRVARPAREAEPEPLAEPACALVSPRCHHRRGLGDRAAVDGSAGRCPHGRCRGVRGVHAVGHRRYAPDARRRDRDLHRVGQSTPEGQAVTVVAILCVLGAGDRRPAFRRHPSAC